MQITGLKMNYNKSEHESFFSHMKFSLPKLFSIALVFVFIFTCNVWAQPSGSGIVISPLKRNVQVEQATKGMNVQNHVLTDSRLGRRTITDTLDLPFFEDFTSTEVYPDSRLWTDNKVYVNSHFPVSPPSYGVATFDHLNEKGNPYHSLSTLGYGPCDSLTSQPINLLYYTQGPDTFNYSAGSNVYLSFFYQAQGLGDEPEPGDSLVLFLKEKNGKWRNVWRVTGHARKAFEQVMIPVLDTHFFYQAFQFRFVNFAKHTGNLNHWHVDYVRMNRNRNANDVVIEDVAINRTPGPLLTPYTEMPYEHYLTNPAQFRRSNHMYGVRNNFDSTVQSQFQFEAYSRGSQIALSPFANNNRNIFAKSDTTQTFDNFAMDTMQPHRVEIDCIYRINPQARDGLPSLYNSLGNNNVVFRKQSFLDYYAYDDGTAEAGIGLQYGTLPPGPTQFAVKFQMMKRDTLKGIAIHFNQSLENVTGRSFSLMVWKKLEEPQEKGLIYKYFVNNPVYTDTFNGFHKFMFIYDTTIILDPGEFYIGWEQMVDYNLNVGYDQNYAYFNGNKRNENIFINMMGEWDPVPEFVKGAPMIRPLVGREVKFFPGINEKKWNNIQVKVYPNPVLDKVYVEFSEDILADYSLLSLDGRVLSKGQLASSEFIDVSGFSSGLYLLRIQSEGKNYTYKIIKQ
jgi:hypothetical protein